MQWIKSSLPVWPGQPTFVTFSGQHFELFVSAEFVEAVFYDAKGRSGA
jgi:hypothetical protein